MKRTLKLSDKYPLPVAFKVTQTKRRKEKKTKKCKQQRININKCHKWTNMPFISTFKVCDTVQTGINGEKGKMTLIGL